MGFLGDIGRAIGGAVTGFVTGGPAGAVVGAGAAIAKSIARPRPGTAMVSTGGPYILPPVPGIAGGGYVSADSVIVRKGPFVTNVGVYGPRAAAGFAPAGYAPGGGYATGNGQGTGVQPTYQVPSCPMPIGGGRVAIMPSPCSGYHWNRGRYYVFGDCRTGSSPGVVAPGERLVRNRRINPANAKAASRAARRLNGTVTLLRKIERTIARLVGRAARRGASARGGKGRCKGGCGAVCKCG